MLTILKQSLEPIKDTVIDEDDVYAATVWAYILLNG